MQGLRSGPFLSQASCSVMFMGEPCYDGFDTDQLGAAMDQLNGLHNAALWQLLRVVAAYERKSACQSDGMRTMAEWLCTRYGVGLNTRPQLDRGRSRTRGLAAAGESFRPGKTQLRQVQRPASDHDLGQRVGALGAGGGAQPQCSEVAGAEAPAGDQGRGRQSPPAALAAVDLGRAQEQRQAVGATSGQTRGQRWPTPWSGAPTASGANPAGPGTRCHSVPPTPWSSCADRRWRPTRMRTGPQW